MYWDEKRKEVDKQKDFKYRSRISNKWILSNARVSSTRC